MINIYYSSIYFKLIAEGLKWVIQRYLKTLNIDLTNLEINIKNSITKSESKSKNNIWIIIGLQNSPIIPTGKFIVWNFEQFEVEDLEFNLDKFICIF